MFLFLLFIISCFFVCWLYYQLQALRKEHLRYQNDIIERDVIISSLERKSYDLLQLLGEKDNEVSVLRKQILDLKKEINTAYEYTEKIKERLSRLSKFEKLETLAEIDQELEKLKDKENQIRLTIKKLDKYALLETELEKLRTQEKEYRSKINEHITSANLRAKSIIADANAKASEIAGDSIEVVRDYRRFEKAAKAMRNIIEGYGNQCIIPAQSLLDDLAELYGHTEAGKELKRAREQVKQMVDNASAADCNYVEVNRRETAITFVLDAFNGKVDSILSRVKHDNYGTLRQKILDAFTLVNMNGQAFRDTRITDEYLNARLDELKWACAAQEVRMRQLEEQRKIKERMREEEKARREYEKAINEAAREESNLKKALEVAQRQLAEANESQRMMFESKLAELQLKLAHAEEKNQRALSMAQQTKTGFVYIISNIGSFGEDIYKIGMTRRLEPMDRIKELSDASVPFDFDVHALLESDNAPELESILHKHFILNRVNKVNHRREFFRANVVDIKTQVEVLGLNAHWTLAAEARQYFETQAIEKAINENPLAKEQWIRNQFKLEELELEEIIEGKDMEEVEKFTE